MESYGCEKGMYTPTWCRQSGQDCAVLFASFAGMIHFLIELFMIMLL